MSERTLFDGKRVPLPTSIQLATSTIDQTYIPTEIDRDWESNKLERAGLAAYIIDWGFQRMIQKDHINRSEALRKHLDESYLPDTKAVPSYNLLTIRDLAEEAGVFSSGVLAANLKEEIKMIQSLPQTDFRRRIHDRLVAKTQGFRNFTGKTPAPEERVFEFVVRGVNSAVLFISQPLNAIGAEFKKRYDREPTLQETLTIMRSSYRTIAKIATGSIETIVPLASILLRLSDKERRDFFVLSDDGSRIELNEERWLKFKKKLKIPDPNNLITSCPALAPEPKLTAIYDPFPDTRVHFENVIKGFFGFYLDTLEKFGQLYLPEQDD